MTRLIALDDLHQRHVDGAFTYHEWMAKIEEVLQTAEDRTVKGTEGTYRLGDVADESRGENRRRGKDLLSVVADAPDAEDIREVLMFRPKSADLSPDPYVAAFEGHGLADIYFARLIKKKIVPNGFVLADLPREYHDYDPHIDTSNYKIPMSALEGRVDAEVGTLYLETAIELSPNYNSIKYSGSGYTDGMKAEWFIGSVLSPEELEAKKVREREEKERRIREEVENFYSTDLHSLLVIHGPAMAASVVEAIATKRGLVEAAWMEEDGRLHRLTHTGIKVDAIASGKVITTLEIKEGLQLDSRMVSPEDAAAAINHIPRGGAMG